MISWDCCWRTITSEEKLHFERKMYNNELLHLTKSGVWDDTTKVDCGGKILFQGILSLYPVRPEWTVLWVRCVHLLHCKSSLCLLHLISHPTPVQCRLYKWPTSWYNDCMIMPPVPQDCRLPVFPVIMQALSSTHANYERPAQHHVLPNCGRERAPSSASLHPDLPLRDGGSLVGT